MWIKIKRGLLILIGAVVTLLGAGTAISALLGQYDGTVGVRVAVGLLGILLAALGVFLFRIGTHGSDRDVSDTDLL